MIAPEHPLVVVVLPKSGNALELLEYVVEAGCIPPVLKLTLDMACNLYLYPV